VTTSWSVAQPSKKSSDPRDFKKLNKMCTGQGNHTAPQYYEFRKSNDARVKYGVIRQQRVMLPDKEFAYGKRNRPQTPVGGIIANEFGVKATEQLQQRYAQWKQFVSTSGSSDNSEIYRDECV
jgi:hypothetical protein